MHISEGVLSPEVLAVSVVLGAVGVGYGLKKMDTESVPKVAVLSSAFFVASLVHVPIGPAHAHLVLNGLMGLLLGWAAFPSIFVALLIQAVLFQFGGLTTLGINTLNMALPAVLCHLAFGRFTQNGRPFLAHAAGFLAGAGAVLLSGIMLAASLVFTGESFTAAAGLVLIAHLPVMVMEGFITMFCVAFLKKVRPEVLTIYAK